jgi:hypothetical protein
MELTHLHEINYDLFRFEQIDCIVATCSTEPRCHYFAAHTIKSDRGRYVLVNEKQQNHPQIKKHLELFTRMGYKSTPASVNETAFIDKIMHEILDRNCDSLNVLIDYTCMTRKWYSAIIDAITRNNFLADKINLFLTYTPKKFGDKPGRQSIKYIGPVLSERDGLIKKRPLSMIVALDNSKELVMEAIKKVNPQNILAFMPNCAHDPEYATSVKKNNQALLKQLDADHIIQYNVARPEEIDSMLTSYCLNHRLTSEVMIVPQGPKVFSMMSMLLSVRYPDIKLWEIIAKEKQHNDDHGQPAGKPVVVKVSFLHDEIEIE